jgi:hypothetical protein
MKHTRGPWQEDRGFRDCFNHASGHYTVEDDYMTVYMGEESCENFDPKKHDYCEVWGSNQEANAHLIAAAPELLEACRAAAEALNGKYPWPIRGNPTQKECKEVALEIVLKAIAKAEGRP